MLFAASSSIDWKTVRDTINLTEVVARLLGPAPGRRGERTGRLWWSCPLGTHADQNPSFSVRPGDRKWKCFGCGAKGDAVALVRHLNPAMTFPEAVAFLTGGPAPASKRPMAARQGPATRPPADRTADPSGMHEADALALVEAAAARLWTPEGEDALAYLHGRGLDDETIRAAGVGWTSWVMIPKADGSAFRALGVVIPWSSSGRLALCKIRQPEGRRPKYAEVFRDTARLVCYPGPETIRTGRPLIITEGEFDCLLLSQELSSLDVSVVTLGSASARPGPVALGPMLAAPSWFIATDADEAGDKAAVGWPARARRLRPPEGKDWTEFHATGFNRIRYLWGGIIESPISWEELAARRWGPAREDPEPGIIIDAPPPMTPRNAPPSSLKTCVDSTTFCATMRGTGARW
jgi:DNA primase